MSLDKEPINGILLLVFGRVSSKLSGSWVRALELRDQAVEITH